MTSVKDDILAALIQAENDKPRSQQVRLGPSELGGCREYVRNVMVQTPQQRSEVWPTAAVVGTLVGKHVEDVCEQYLGTLSEMDVTTVLSNGLKVSGHADIVYVARNSVVDVKTKNELHEVLKDGSSLDNKVQISVYALGLVQSGILTEGCTANLIYIDRSGSQQFLHETIIEWPDIMGYAQVAVDRMNDVLEAQDHIDQGEVECARDLRDKTPPFCYSERVLCPFRDLCWAGSEWVPHEVIQDVEIIEAVERYVEIRDGVKANDSLRREYREKLVGVSGVTPSGYAVNWSGTDARPALYVTKVK